MSAYSWQLCFLLVLAVSANSPCTGEDPKDLLQTGVVEFTNSGYESSSCFSIPIRYNIPSSGFKTALSTTNFGGYKPLNGLDYSVRGGQKGSSNLLAITLVTGDNSWTKITVSYLATSRPDFLVGSLYADLVSAFGCDSSSNQVALSYNVGILANVSAPKVQVFVAGLSTQDTLFNLDLKNIAYNSKTGVLSVSVYSDAAPIISDLRLSFVIYDAAALPSRNPIEDDYQFTLTAGFSGYEPKVLAISFDTDRLNCVGSGCGGVCTSSKECAAKGGVVQGNDCIVCGPFQKIQGKKCVPNCKANQVFNNGVCECAPGYMKFIGECVFRCGINEIWVNEACRCKPNTAKINGVCRECPANSIAAADGSQCICNKDHLWNPDSSTCDFVICGNNSHPELIKGQYVCKCNDNAYLSPSGLCKLIPTCPKNSIFNIKLEKCECQISNEYLIDGICQACGELQKFNGVKCVCIDGYIYGAKGCIPQCKSTEDFINGACVCKPNHILVNKVCQACPENSEPSADRTKCVCISEYLFDTVAKKCVSGKCLENASPVQTDTGIVCKCNPGTYLEDGWCKLNPTCPPRSKWSQDRLACLCTIPGEYLIDNTCQACKANEGWNGQICACKTGFFKINGVCQTCDPNTRYNGKDCVCNLGFYGTRDKCEKCHSTCSQCTGPAENQCTLCSDVSYNLKNGVCTRNDPCPSGLYLDTSKICKPCSAYCSTCVSENVCNTCISGFELTKLSWGGVEASYCSEKCGDGKRFELDCDDGNTRSGDGCNANCEVEKGWICQGGSSIRASTCAEIPTSRSFVTLTGTVHLFGRVVQGVRLSYIPPELTANDCALCSKLLWVRVISSDVIPGVRVNYLPKSKYQFMTEFDFNGLFSIPVFTVSIQINPDFAKYFTDADLAQIQVKTIDPAVLAKIDNNRADLSNELSFDEIDLSIDPTNIPDQAKKILFPN